MTKKQVISIIEHLSSFHANVMTVHVHVVGETYTAKTMGTLEFKEWAEAAIHRVNSERLLVMPLRHTTRSLVQEAMVFTESITSITYEAAT